MNAKELIEKYITKDQDDWLVQKKEIVAKFMNAFAAHKIEEVREKAFKTGVFGVYTNILNNIFDEILKDLK